jgi:hypothetical protein
LEEEMEEIKTRGQNLSIKFRERKFNVDGVKR